MTYITDRTITAQQASLECALASTQDKNNFLSLLASLLRKQEKDIIQANAIDVEAQRGKISDALLDRLTLNPKRIEAMAVACEELIELADPNGSIMEEFVRPNGLRMKKVRVPLGVIAIIYESRPNVTIDAASLCLKAGNAVILRGGKEALHSNQKLIEILHLALSQAGLNPDAVQFIDNPDRSYATELMQDRQHVDVLIPRGSARLIQTVVDNAKIPVLETGVGNCHIYVQEDADLDWAEAILINAKCSRPGVCNAAEKVIVDASIAQKFLASVIPQLTQRNVELRGCEKTCTLFPNLIQATDEDWDTEYLDLILGIKIVANIDEAIKHIQAHSTKHSEAIITRNKQASTRFQKEIDAAAVYVNASTRFTDGSEMGFGAEIGISTQKLHARGPMGLNELCTYKYLIEGNGQIR